MASSSAEVGPCTSPACSNLQVCDPNDIANAQDSPDAELLTGMLAVIIMFEISLWLAEGESKTH